MYEVQAVSLNWNSLARLPVSFFPQPWLTFSMASHYLEEDFAFLDNATRPASSTAIIRCASYTHPAHVPPPANCKAAQRRVSSGKAAFGARSFRVLRRARTCSPSSGVKRDCPSPTRSTLPSLQLRSRLI